jgi:5'-nucleotidase/UDP-sugar diphosphatase
VDSGDIFDVFPFQVRHKYVKQVYYMFNYDALTIGDQDLVEGTLFFFDFTAGLQDKIVNTNFYINERKIGRDYRLKKLKDITFGITATIDSTTFRYIDDKLKKDISFSDQNSSLKPVVAKLHETSDYCILISHSGLSRDRELAQVFPDIDLIIGGHSQDELEEPVTIGKTLIVQAGENGYHLGVLRLLFKNRTCISYTNQLCLLDHTIVNDREIQEIISQYRRERYDSLIRNHRIQDYRQ